MPHVAIVTDSTAYLSQDTINRYNVQVAPLKVHWKGKTYLDGIDLTPFEFYKRLEKETEIPTTSQPSIQEFLDIFEKLSKDYDGIIVPLISSGISGTVASAQSAAAQFDRVPVRVIDSHSTCMALTLVILAIGRAIEAGKDLAEVTALAQSITANMHTYFVVDTLKYLHLGGRIGGASRYLGTALNIKPVLYFNDEGKIDALERVRTRGKALDRLVELAKETTNGKPAHVGIVQANVPERAELVKNKITSCIQCEEIFIQELSPVIGSHVGPGALGVAIYNE